MDRSKGIKKVSWIGIGSNVLLAGFKAAVGLLSGSIAVILDAVNNLTDALSSGITILGITLAGKKPDSKHPFGYGRVEYLCSMVISAIVLFAGITAAVESAKRIAEPEMASYGLASVIVISAAILAKFLLGSYVKKQGKMLESDSLVASGTEALGDCALSASTLVAIAVTKIWGISIEGYIGVVIAAIIIKAGIELMMGSLSMILGKRAQGELAGEIKAEIAAVEGVLGVYDLVLHDYGPSAAIGTVHVEIDDKTSASEIHQITKKVQNAVMKRFHILLTVGIYASNTTDPEIVGLKESVGKVVRSQEGVRSMHGFFCDGNYISFDIVVDFGCDTKEAIRNISDAIIGKIPDADIHITIDRNFTE